VVGVLKGSDPALRDTYILVTAHYDHLGKRDRPDGEDGIYNGANDDGSGTVGVIELASALAARKVRPKRTVVFMTFFGEERGLLGSRYYGKNPLFPIEKTIAHLNLEQIGRTDDTEAPRVGALSMTGYDYSDIGPIFSKAAGLVGVKVEKHPRFSDAFFARSDNQALADLGIPAHTLCTALVLQGVAQGLLSLANSPTTPRWNASNPRAARYLTAWKERHPQAIQ
jgi:Zn-dependent M28 family amino/carboxypeptidase